MLLNFFQCKSPHIRAILFIILYLSASANAPLWADQVTDLYEVTVPVASQDKQERSDAIRTAFSEVLVRVSGRADIVRSADYPNIQTAIETATHFAQQFRYRQLTPQPGSDQPAFALWVRFDETAITRLLRTNNLPVWGTTRPSTLVWLAIDERGHRELLGNNSKQEALSILLEQAKRRGVPLTLPLLDLTDRSSLRVSDVWGNFESTILKASQRYQTEAVLVGRMYQGYGGWNARWSLYADSRRRDWSLTGASINEVLLPGIDITAETLAMRYAQVGESNDGRILLQVKDIKNLADYNRSLKYLKTISAVSAVNPYEVAAHTAIFELSTAAGRLGIARAVSLGHTLVSEPVQTVPIPDLPVTGATTDKTESKKEIVPDLIYRLVP